MELIVQLIEGIFYIWLVLSISTVKNITPHRYYDWFFTTPTMLISLIIYFIYLKYKKTDNDEKLKRESFFSILNKNKVVIVPIILLNALMLGFGLLGEKKYLTINLSVFLGFIPFLIYFYIIYKNFIIHEYANLFWYFFIVWAIYGIFALLPYYWKNSGYNLLDLLAKNFFGLFLAYVIYTGIKEEKNKDDSKK